MFIIRAASHSCFIFHPLFIPFNAVFLLRDYFFFVFFFIFRFFFVSFRFMWHNIILGILWYSAGVMVWF